MMSLTENLPGFNAALNGTATLLLTAGFVFIQTERESAHRKSMLAAFCVSVLFLFSYVLHKILVKGVHTPFGGEGFWALFYYTMLISHIILAISVVPLVIKTMSLALRGKRSGHKAWARWTFPIWYYVSVTGVLVYFFLYQWF